MRRLCLASVLVLSVSIATTDVLSQQHRSQAVARLSGNVDLARCLDLIATDLGLTVVYDRSDLQAIQVSVRGDVENISAELVPIVQQELRASGFAVIPASLDPNSFSIVRESEAAEFVPVSSLAEFEGRSPSLRTYWRVRVPVGTLSEQAVRSASRLVDFGTSSRVTQRNEHIVLLAETNEAVITGYTGDVESILNQFDALSRLGERVATRSIPVLNGDAAAVVDSVRSILDAKSALSFQTYRGIATAAADDSAVIVTAPLDELELWESAIRDVVRPDAIKPLQYRIDGIDPERLSSILASALEATRPNQDEVRSFANPLTGTLTIWTDAEGHDFLRQLIDEVTNPSPSRQRQLAKISVHHRNVADLSGQVESALAALTGLDTPAPGVDPNEFQATDPLELETRQDSRRPSNALVAIDTDEETNSLIVIGTPVEIEQVRELVTQLDVPTVQVQLEVLLLSLSESDTFDLGIELSKIQETGGTTFRLSSLFGLGVDAAAATLPGDGRDRSGPRAG